MKNSKKLKKGGELRQAGEQEDVNEGRKKRDIKGGETKLGSVRQIESDSDSIKTGWQSESVLSGWTEPIYPDDLAITPQYMERALLNEGNVSFATLSGERTPGSRRESGKCHRLPMEDMVEACWGGVTPSTVVNGDAGVGRVCDDSHGD